MEGALFRYCLHIMCREFCKLYFRERPVGSFMCYTASSCNSDLLGLVSSKHCRALLCRLLCLHFLSSSKECFLPSHSMWMSLLCISHAACTTLSARLKYHKIYVAFQVQVWFSIIGKRKLSPNSFLASFSGIVILSAPLVFHNPLFLGLQWPVRQHNISWELAARN